MYIMIYFITFYYYDITLYKMYIKIYYTYRRFIDISDAAIKEYIVVNYLLIYIYNNHKIHIERYILQSQIYIQLQDVII